MLPVPVAEGASHALPRYVLALALCQVLALLAPPSGWEDAVARADVAHALAHDLLRFSLHQTDPPQPLASYL